MLAIALRFPKTLRFSNRRPVLRVLAGTGAVGFSLTAYIYLTLPDVRPLRTTNPETTAFMELRDREAARDGTRQRRVYRWVPYSRISPNLRLAVRIAEDDAFFEHDGLDLQQLRRTLEEDLPQGRTVRGASTITQQLAKNLYLSPSRNPIRKLTELFITRRLEAELSKPRIFEIYLNVIEWGDGIWGAEAAARTYFKTSAAALSREQAALLAAAIINPRVLTPARPTPRLLRRRALILSRMNRGGRSPSLPSRNDPPPSPVSPSESLDVEANGEGRDEVTFPLPESPGIAQ